MIERHRLIDAGAYLLLTLGLVFATGPLYVAVCSATVSNPQLFAHGLALIPGDQLLENLQQVTRRLDLLRLLGNSLLVATLVVIGKLTLSALTAFAVVYFRSRYTSVIFFAVLGALLLPLEVRIIPTYAVASDLLGPLRNLLQWLGIQWLPVPTINLLDSYTGLALPLIASATGTFLFRQFYQTLPAELVEAARMDGAGPWRFLSTFCCRCRRPTSQRSARWCSSARGKTTCGRWSRPIARTCARWCWASPAFCRPMQPRSPNGTC
ncbi:Glycerol-3-phosphate ABC transporter, permease protein [Pseudomonas savastanoi pv. glycinea]|uniref:sn-glycerol-3-phosphate transport system permease protein UgpE n=1 Tax=Pseudomonas savastanoi pv. glycinea TaxID=318 RepID=A0A3M5VBN5_PSESG|nr:Glycerol-3-phosphate ABC transporter, permease protein [Pseudomonas savastanoi pv. glycinea]RMO51595.1 Glycerol-3-phosphate ABC transporter, permease protein [Pseudomonas savastanoi pv. glycinea]RMU55599.1 Glycerol-3-phosphate ABC transporter, permease protein [Pseudomonas savastanoi pv. glycinea]